MRFENIQLKALCERQEIDLADQRQGGAAAKSQDTIRELTEQNTRLRAERARMSEELAALKALLAEAQLEAKQLRTTADMATQRAITADKANASLSQRLDTANRERKQVKAAIPPLEQRWKNAHSEATSKCESMRRELNELRAAHSVAQAQLTSLRKPQADPKTAAAGPSTAKHGHAPGKPFAGSPRASLGSAPITFGVR